LYDFLKIETLAFIKVKDKEDKIKYPSNRNIIGVILPLIQES